MAAAEPDVTRLRYTLARYPNPGTLSSAGVPGLMTEVPIPGTLIAEF
jgi:hypothetical protein